MNGVNTSRIGHSTDCEGITYSLKPAQVVQDGIATSVHLVATAQNAALTYGDAYLPLGALVLLVADEIPLPARVSWSDGRRARLENR